jgi:hypothetical protein
VRGEGKQRKEKGKNRQIKNNKKNPTKSFKDINRER